MRRARGIVGALLVVAWSFTAHATVRVLAEPKPAPRREAQPPAQRAPAPAPRAPAQDAREPDPRCADALLGLSLGADDSAATRARRERCG